MIRDTYSPPDWAWRYDAKCMGEDTEGFFPPRDRTKYKAVADQAKAICNGTDGRPPCPVLRECLRYAIDSNEEHGILGGMSHRERNALKRRYTSASMTLDEWIDSGGKTIKKRKPPAKSSPGIEQA